VPKLGAIAFNRANASPSGPECARSRSARGRRSIPRTVRAARRHARQHATGGIDTSSRARPQHDKRYDKANHAPTATSVTRSTADAIGPHG